METQAAALRPYDPALACRKCLNEEVGVTWHARQIIDSGLDPAPCAREQVGSIGEHLCLRCMRCGYSWLAAPADGQPYYAKTGETEEESDMTIRKTGSAADQAVVGIESQSANDETQPDLVVPQADDDEMEESLGHGASYEG